MSLLHWTHHNHCKFTTGQHRRIVMQCKQCENNVKTNFEKILRVFFETHDPTQKNGQGPDIGPQYKSAIFYLDESQKKIAEDLIQILEAKGFSIATEVLPAGVFYSAESYHQDYYDRKGGVPYCHGYRKLF